jgi:transcriptional regulator with XRE-family HTH domain
MNLVQTYRQNRSASVPQLYRGNQAYACYETALVSHDLESSHHLAIYFEQLLDRIDPHMRLIDGDIYHSQISAAQSIQLRRQQLGLTMADVAERTHLSLSDIQLIEAGVAHPAFITLESMKRLARVLAYNSLECKQVMVVLATALGDFKYGRCLPLVRGHTGRETVSRKPQLAHIKMNWKRNIVRARMGDSYPRVLGMKTKP